MNLENIKQSERSQAQKAIYCMIRQIHSNQKQVSICQGLEQGFNVE